MKKLTGISTALLIGASFSSSAMAVVPMSTTASTTGGTTASTVSLTASVNSDESSKTTSGKVSASAVNLAQFDTSTGILVGAKVKVSGVTTANTVDVSGTVDKKGKNRTVDAESRMAGSIAGTGFTSFTNAATKTTADCSADICASSSSNSASGATLAGSATVATGSLAAYAGTGTVALDRSATGSVKVTTGKDANSGTAAASYAFSGGTYSIDYEYLNFSAPSFDGGSVVRSLNLDFGTRALGSGPVTLNFSLFNIGNENSAGVSLTGLTRDTGSSQFATSLSSFTNLAGGASQSYSITFDVSQLGVQQDIFRLAMADYAPDGVGGQTYDLDINVSGTGFEDAVGGVPEPSTWMTLIAGFGLVGVSARNRRGRGAVAA